VKIAIIGAGWAGLAGAVKATQLGHTATVFEASHALGGRARALHGSKPLTLPNGQQVLLDNGQHILIGAYSATLAMLREVGIQVESTLLDLPMTLQFPDALGLRFAQLPTPLDALAGIVRARGWSLSDKWTLLRVCVGWQLQGFGCAKELSVSDICQSLTPRVMNELIEPLCVSALNTPPARSSARVFLRVLHDALFAVQGGSHLLLPRTDLTTLFPAAAADWVKRHGGHIQLGARVTELQQNGQKWLVDGTEFDRVILATSASNAAVALTRWAQAATPSIANMMLSWSAVCRALQHEAIATVYAWAEGVRLAQPMLALHSTPTAPAQFVFDRGQLGNPAGLLAFVVSTAQGTRESLQQQVLAQARAQLGLSLHPIQTVLEKRATFACTPALQRPPAQIAPGLLACGDYVDGPYPATLEGAVRSGIAAAQAI